EITSERITSSVTTPPALRITCASPSTRPSSTPVSSRASMHATTAMCRAGGIGRWPLSKRSAYFALCARKSSIAVIPPSLSGPRLLVGGFERLERRQVGLRDLVLEAQHR